MPARREPRKRAQTCRLSRRPGGVKRVVDVWGRWGSVPSGRRADRMTLAAEVPPSRGRLPVRRRSARHGFRRAELPSGWQRMHVACTSPAARTNCGFSASERFAGLREPSMATRGHGYRRDDQSKRAGIGRCVDLAARTRTADIVQGAVGVIDPRCHPANARLLGTVQPNHSRLGFTRRREGHPRAPCQHPSSDKSAGSSVLFRARSNPSETLSASGTSGMHRLSRCASNLVFRAAAPASPDSRSRAPRRRTD
jgi:hypothetical protein